jgi:hypothetical protein
MSLNILQFPIITKILDKEQLNNFSFNNRINLQEDQIKKLFVLSTKIQNDIIYFSKCKEEEEIVCLSMLRDTIQQIIITHYGFKI